MSQTYTITNVRNNIYDLADKVIKTGMPIKIKRGDKILLLTPEKRKNKLENLVQHEDVVNGSIDDLIDVKVWDKKTWQKKQKKYT